MSEAQIIKKIKAKPVKNSGRGFYKGDCLWKSYLIDIKEGKSLNLNQSVWDKVTRDAYQHGWEKNPAILRVLESGEMIMCVPFAVIEAYEEMIEGLLLQLAGDDV